MEWQNATLLEGSVESAVRSLKEQVGGDLHVVGSTQPVKTLLEHNLVDAFRLMIDPLVLGGGKRFLLDDGVQRPMHLRDSTVTSSDPCDLRRADGLRPGLARSGVPTRSAVRMGDS